MSAIVVGFTDSPNGQRALGIAIEESRLRDARLIVVHSMEGGPKTSEDEFMRYQVSLENVGTQLSELGVDYEIHEYVRSNTPAEDLAAAVEEFGAELVVIGYRRRTATGKALLGSDAQDILVSSPVPVLAVGPPL